MPFSRPDLDSIVERIKSELAARLPSEMLRYGPTQELGKTIGGEVNELYGHLEWGFRQLFTHLSEAAELDRQADEYGLVRVAATTADGSAQFTGQPGSLIAAGTALRGPNGLEYFVVTDSALGSGVDGNGATSITVQALEAGSTGNLAEGSSLNLISPVAGVATRAVVLAPGLAGGTEAESDDSLRQRVLDRKRLPPHGGNENDYVAWVKAALPGVSHVWVAEGAMGLGSITIRFAMHSVRENGIPTEDDVAVVEAYIKARDRKPLGATVYVVAPIPVALDFSIAISPNTAAVRAAVQASLADLILREAAPGDANGSGTLLISRLREAVSTAAGESDNAVSLPSADAVPGPGEIFVMGAITWTGTL
ncbi:baseplate J/gp47 family protein [Ferrovibrio sp.]|uniref:baseplate J/gp47 family protein n=1 Tax=Ferrovibrio sp. TaxID=1917215 RepID=UPI0035B22213